MRFHSLLPPAAALLIASFAAAEDASDVLSLTASTFESTVNPESLILVEFFAPWCGHCKALAPHYEEAATALKDKNIKLAKVDCVEEPDLCQSHGVQGYPTLKVFKNGTPSEYSGPRKADGIISYMVKQSLPAVSEVDTKNFEEFKKSDRLVAVAYLASSTDAPAAEFSSLADKHRDDYLFGLSTDKDTIALADVKPPAIVVYRSFDAPVTHYPFPADSAKESELEEWINELAVPIIDEVNGDNYAIYAQSSKPLAYLFLDPSDEEKKEETIKMIRPIAAQFKSKVNFVWIDAIKFGDHAKALNLVDTKWPAFVVQDLGKQLKYPYDQGSDLNAKNIEDWVVKFLDGKLEPALKSAAIPESQDEPVFTLVGKQFDEVVFDDSKDVFLELYATWCGHCKRLKPTWDTLGETYSDRKDKITIAKMEAQENDLPPSAPFRVGGFPTIKFKPAGTREFIDYEGDRTLESLIEFVESHAKNDLTKPKVAASPDDAQTPLKGETKEKNETTAPVKEEIHDEL